MKKTPYLIGIVLFGLSALVCAFSTGRMGSSNSNGGSGSTSSSGSGGAATWPVSGTPTDLAEYNSSGTFSATQIFQQRVLFSSSIFTNGAVPNDAANVILGSQFAYLKNGRIGIGTINPQANLEIFTTNAQQNIFRASSLNVGDTIRNDFVTNFGGASTNVLTSLRTEIISIEPGPLKSALEFFTNRGNSIQEAARFTENGSFGVGSTTPSARVEISTPSGVTLITSSGPAADQRQFQATTSSVTVFTATFTARTIVADQFVQSGNSGVGSWSSLSNQLNLDPANTGSPVVQVNPSSTTINGPVIMNTTDTYNLIGQLVQVRFSTAVFSTPTLNTGNFQNVVFDAALGIGSQEAIYKVFWSTSDANVDPVVYAAEALSTGTHPNQISCSISVATMNVSIAGGVASFDSLPWVSTVTIVMSTPSAAGTYVHQSTSAIPLTGWKTPIGSGRKWVYIRVINVNGLPQDSQRMVTAIFADKQKNTR